jgi:hypothetical protein
MFIRRSADSKPGAAGAALPDVASTAELRAWVEALAVPRHFFIESAANRRTALWIAERFRDWEFDVAFHGECRNVVATPVGLRGPAILIGAHYDSAPHCPGADDNASAVAAMLAVAQACATVSPRLPVAFAAFNREEDGLLGSTEFVGETLPALPWQVSHAHILEMVGYALHEAGSQRVPEGLPIKLPDTADFLGLLANGDSAALLREVLSQARGSLPDFPVLGLEVRLGLERFLPVLRRSDHVPFWQQRIPALMWTDTSEFRNPHYHQSTDTPDTLDYDFLRRTAQLLAGWVLATATEDSDHG